MCGIAGILDLKGQTTADDLTGLASGMASRLAHRGPDQDGDFTDAQAGMALAHCRLSILDLSDAGRQPMQSRNGRFVLAFNGEIYNHAEIRSLLERDGHFAGPWRGRSDSEVLVEAVAALGFEKTLALCAGMFAVAVWDREARTLFLARDRLGEKPLYYARLQDRFVFASELKALAGLPGFSPAIDRDALTLYLRLSCIPAPRTIYRGVLKLPAGTWLAVRPGDREAEPRPYWSLAQVMRVAVERPFSGSEDEAITELERLLSRAVSDEMVADVPLGVLLSGGVDSSLIAALMQEKSDRPVRSFTIGFTDRSHDESADAARVARFLGTEHTELTATAKDALDLVPELARVYDEPFADPSQVPTLLLARLTRAHVTVCLTGDGGDEAFAGYNRHVAGPGLLRRLSALPAGLRRILSLGIAAVPPGLWEGAHRLASPLLSGRLDVRLFGDKMRKLGRVLPASDLASFYRGLVSAWPEPADLVVGGVEPRSILDAPGPFDAVEDPLLRLQALDLAWYLPDDILVKVDRAAMSVALETRAPYLDHRVVEFALRLPAGLKVGHGLGKRCLRELLYRRVPRDLVERPKMGFGPPLGAWLRGPLRDWAAGLLEPHRLARQGLLNPLPVARCFEAHCAGRADNSQRLWAVLMLQAWLETQK